MQRTLGLAIFVFTAKILIPPRGRAPGQENRHMLTGNDEIFSSNRILHADADVRQFVKMEAFNSEFDCYHVSD